MIIKQFINLRDLLIFLFKIVISHQVPARIFQCHSQGRTIFMKKSAAVRMVDIFQPQMRKKCSEARVKMHRDITFAAAWWSWLMR